MRFRAAARQMVYIVGRYQQVVMIHAEEKGAEHREKEHKQAHGKVACPYKRSGDNWGDENHDINEQGLFSGEIDSKLSVCASVPNGCGEMNCDKSCNRDLVHGSPYKVYLMLAITLAFTCDTLVRLARPRRHGGGPQHPPR